MYSVEITTFRLRTYYQPSSKGKKIILFERPSEVIRFTVCNEQTGLENSLHIHLTVTMRAKSQKEVNI